MPIDDALGSGKMDYYKRQIRRPASGLREPAPKDVTSGDFRRPWLASCALRPVNEKFDSSSSPLLAMPPAISAARIRELQLLLLGICAYVTTSMFLAICLYSSSNHWKQPYHTFKLSGHAWVQELIHGHPERIQNELGMRVHVFVVFVGELRACGLKNTGYIQVKEQAAIFLYMCVTGLKIWHVAEKFQHANDTISKYVFCYCFPLTIHSHHSDTSNVF